MKQNFFIVIIGVLATVACQNKSSVETRHYHWIGEEYEEVIMAQRGNVFRGEYIDPGFQERASVPIAGIIDTEGNVYGAGFDRKDGTLYGKFTGKITGNSFEANWSPLPNAASEHRSWNLIKQKLSHEVEQEIKKYDDAFYNWLFPELELCTSRSVPQDRETPFLPEQIVVASGRTYGYQIGEWDIRTLRLMQAAKANEVDFHVQVEINGLFWIKIDIQGTARLNGNSFRYKDKGYEFEVAIYNDFAVITTINGTVDLSDFKDQDVISFSLDEVYPLLPKGFVDKEFYEINFYCGGENDANMSMEETITKDILSMPEMQFPNAAIMIVDGPTADQPFFVVKAGSNMEGHFATSFWLRVYTAPEYEIKIYDIISNSDMTLEEWRDINSANAEALLVEYDDLPELGTHKERAFCINGKWGLIEPGNNIIVPAEYDDIGVFKGDYDDNNNFTGKGLAAVKRNGKWGFINRKNDLVIPYKYDRVEQDTWGSRYRGEVAFVERDGLSFWIDNNGKENEHDY